jgi:hypothetical protein
MGPARPIASTAAGILYFVKGDSGAEKNYKFIKNEKY